MRLEKISGKTALCLAACLMLGVVISLWVSQRIWAEANNVRINSYAQSILHHAETIAQTLTQTLVILEDSDNLPCSADDLTKLKEIVFMQRYVRDAGRIKDGVIMCTALWGVLSVPFAIKDSGRTTKNNVTLWNHTPSYITADSRMDISAKGNAFVATSNAAFSAYESERDDLSANITSPDDSVIMRAFGDQQVIKLESRPVRLCSSRFAFCINAAVQNSIFSMGRLKILSAIIFSGACLGLLIWYSIGQMLTHKNTLAMRLKDAIKKDQIELHYQPIVHASSGKTSGFEALARWHDTIEGAVSPGIFIKLTDELGISIEFSKAIISKAFRECAPLLKKQPDIYLSLNLSTSDLLSEDILKHLNRYCTKYRIPSTQIAIEILETSTTDLGRLQERIDDYRREGYLIFIDDFGTGYSSLSYLSRLKIDTIKIDKTFTQTIGIDASAEFILSQIKNIAISIGARVIYEGIETETQRQAILKLTTSALAQGWLFSKAVPISQLEQNIETESQT
ncbi:EAL domain-containing protein [Pseudomonas kurunegalensis]|uniref:EAL domain-containing protein n=1 Tax=Pseudomonas kurunegalensis TaxID=485880 RepID=UPI0023636B13|nr:EAL domain-containing protein [Pseudomonas kurunegalensis]MDD2133441.1 EAL domain-containing protein [Pseudomonas kurunegalensis]